MRPLVKKLALPVAVVSVAALAWASTANSAPPDPETGLFRLQATSTLNVSCPAPNGPGTTLADFSAEVLTGGGSSDDGQVDPVDPTDIAEVDGYFGSAPVIGTFTIPLNGSFVLPAGSTLPCPATIPDTVNGTVTATAFIDPELGPPQAGGDPAGAPIQINFVAPSS